MMYAPIGVFGLMAYTVTKHGLSVLLPLGKVIVIMYLGCAILFCCMFLPLVKFIVRIPVKRFVKGMLEPFMIGFTTCSSAAALPSNMRCAEELGASRTVASFGIPLGNTINMNGTALYMGINTIFVAEVFGIPMPFDTQLTVILMSILAAVGTMSIFSLKCCAFQTIRPVVSRKKRGFSAHFGPGGAVLPPSRFTFFKVAAFAFHLFQS